MRNPAQGKNGRLAVVYLARQADGVDEFARFARSYQDYDAGVPHELVVIYKGFESSLALDEARAVFAALPHQAIEVDDTGFDIGAYFIAARQLDHRLVCFLGTHTTIVADHWLQALAHHASQPHVGIAAAMGSLESLVTSWRLIQRVKRLGYSARHANIAATEYYFGWLLNSAPTSAPQSTRSRLRSILSRAKRSLRGACDEWRNCHYVPGLSPAMAAELSRFPRFPNPHVRTNGFMMERERFLAVEFPASPTKWDAYAFESGRDSLTARVRRQGLATVVVDRYGESYDVDAWARSGTFRLGSQANLLISDNQTRLFADMSPGQQAAFARFSWGDYLADAPADFPRLNLDFARDPKVIAARPFQRVDHQRFAPQSVA